ncbi:Uncharacterised protein [Serratia fonticola]|uniref:Uncharacterized protein n=1 Tax=Serratia fonticola TaxID=47917 RepID=A0A4U9TCM4_SERFO|nr:Uncharacterised protein [Serratia fonticola]
MIENAFLRELLHQLIDFGFGADVNATGRLIKNKDVAVIVQPAAMTTFLLVAAAQGADAVSASGVFTPTARIRR